MEEPIEERWWKGPLIYILAIFLILLIVVMVIPTYTVKYDPYPRQILSVEAVFSGTSSQENFSMSKLSDIYNYINTGRDIKKVADKVSTAGCDNNRVCNAKALFYFVRDNLIQAQTATFLTIAMFELYQAFACRSTIYPAIKVGLFKNKWLILATLSSFILIVALIFIPAFGNYLDMVPITLTEFLVIIAVSSIGAIIIELSKHVKTRNEEITV